MVTLLTQHTVQDFQWWREIFGSHEGNRRRHGATGHQIYRTGNDVVVLTDFPDRSSAHAFLADPALVKLSARAGFLAPPTTAILDHVVTTGYHDSAAGSGPATQPNRLD